MCGKNFTPHPPAVVVAAVAVVAVVAAVAAVATVAAVARGEGEGGRLPVVMMYIS